MICTAEAMATSRSAEVPPVSTVMRMVWLVGVVVPWRRKHGQADRYSRPQPGPSEPSALSPYRPIVLCLTPSPDELLKDVIPTHDPHQLPIAPHQGRGALPREHRPHSVHRGSRVDLGEGRLHDLAYRALQQRRLGKGPGHERALDQASHRLAIVEHWNLAHAPGRHQ